MHHPCQSLADMMTILAKLGRRMQRVVLTWAWHRNSANGGAEQFRARGEMGHDLVIARPSGYDLDEELIETSGRLATHLARLAIARHGCGFRRC